MDGYSRMEQKFEFCGRKVLIGILQVLIVLASFWVSFFLRFDFALPEAFLFAAFWLMPPLIVSKLLIFWWFGLFSGWWRYVSIPDLVVLLRANLFASLAFAPMTFFLFQFKEFPFSVLIIDSILCFLFMGGVRVGARMLREQVNLKGKKGRNRQKVVIAGAGAVGQTFVREIRQNPHLNMSILGFIDNDADRQKQSFLGVPVLGTAESLKAIFQQQQVDQVIVAQGAVGSGLCGKLSRRAGRQEFPRKFCRRSAIL